ncbi:sigma-54-dependent Fis family transcriptional regulator [candidate division KSB3 bacterium]|uniref:Sigma-54-dependent Fis family transcriptional regulator n=1 Tax=candidate division KSB3 bacterium TaxID=2044937 RepID=A0A2G6E793_9BACT|nr:MAG: sigma-54-dependent Fis family transcriptional regulator [candidate division KSB3 bacterium]PIE30167.1 MAG: sigma-54-dependent Fis family transcriptional regulator [candidate division KSB3 bacterium]
MQKTLLIIDDNAALCNTLSQTFRQLGYQAFSALNSIDASACLSRHNIQVALLDMMLGHEDGLDVLQQLLSVSRELPVIMITGYASIESAVQAIKLGAFDYVKKPLDFEQLVKVIEKALKVSSQTEAAHSDSAASAPQIITQHPGMLEVCNKAKKLAASDLPVLLLGEHGTGKEVMADYIHAHSPRCGRSMLKINCAAFPETLLDNELFGHEKGAYTGANSCFKGVFERAGRSSLFLDEISDMPLAIQAKILRTLQNREIRRLGGNTTLTVDVRFIAATNKDVRRFIQEERFREDLYYRLNAAVIRIPSLRERKNDLPLLTEYFLHEYSKEHDCCARDVDPAVQESFRNYHWPGNIRELKNVLNYAATISVSPSIRLEDLPPDFPAGVHSSSSAPNNIRDEMEKNLILSILRKTGYNKKKSAELLNMSRKTLYSRLKKYGISSSAR